MACMRQRRVGGLTSLAWMLLLTACNSEPPALQIEKVCVSDSGMSTYDVRLNTAGRRGTIRYMYMGQDIRYAVNRMTVDGSVVSGEALFAGSATGETRGTPILFRYDHQADVFEDGQTTARCRSPQR